MTFKMNVISTCYRYLKYIFGYPAEDLVCFGTQKYIFVKKHKFYIYISICIYK